MSFALLYITHAGEDEARRICNVLLEQRLVACANLFPISSAYWWQGSITKDEEWVSLVKTSLSKVAAVEAAVEKLHPYQTPCIMQWTVKANAAYEAWINAEVDT